MGDIPYTPSRRQVVATALFGYSAANLKRQLDGPIQLPADVTDIELIELEEIARQAWTSGKGSAPGKIVQWHGQILEEQKARWLVVQEARIELRRRSK